MAIPKEIIQISDTIWGNSDLPQGRDAGGGASLCAEEGGRSCNAAFLSCSYIPVEPIPHSMRFFTPGSLTHWVMGIGGSHRGRHIRQVAAPSSHLAALPAWKTPGLLCHDPA